MVALTHAASLPMPRLSTARLIQGEVLPTTFARSPRYPLGLSEPWLRKSKGVAAPGVSGAANNLPAM
eukprot:5419954-Alexandrium_andersonii.AAC.1